MSDNYTRVEDTLSGIHDNKSLEDILLPGESSSKATTTLGSMSSRTVKDPGDNIDTVRKSNKDTENLDDKTQHENKEQSDILLDSTFSVKENINIEDQDTREAKETSSIIDISKRVGKQNVIIDDLSSHNTKTEEKIDDEVHEEKIEDEIETGDHESKTENKIETNDHEYKTEDKIETGKHEYKTEDKIETGDHENKTEDKIETGDHENKTEDKIETGKHEYKTEINSFDDGDRKLKDGEEIEDEDHLEKTESEIITSGHKYKTEDEIPDKDHESKIEDKIETGDHDAKTEEGIVPDHSDSPKAKGLDDFEGYVGAESDRDSKVQSYQGIHGVADGDHSTPTMAINQTKKLNAGADQTTQSNFTYDQVVENITTSFATSFPKDERDYDTFNLSSTDNNYENFDYNGQFENQETHKGEVRSFGENELTTVRTVDVETDYPETVYSNSSIDVNAKYDDDDKGILKDLTDNSFKNESNRITKFQEIIMPSDNQIPESENKNFVDDIETVSNLTFDDTDIQNQQTKFQQIDLPVEDELRSAENVDYDTTTDLTSLPKNLKINNLNSNLIKDNNAYNRGNPSDKQMASRNERDSKYGEVRYKDSGDEKSDYYNARPHFLQLFSRYDLLSMTLDYTTYDPKRKMLALKILRTGEDFRIPTDLAGLLDDKILDKLSDNTLLDGLENSFLKDFDPIHIFDVTRKIGIQALQVGMGYARSTLLEGKSTEKKTPGDSKETEEIGDAITKLIDKTDIDPTEFLKQSKLIPLATRGKTTNKHVDKINASMASIYTDMASYNNSIIKYLDEITGGVHQSAKNLGGNTSANNREMAWRDRLAKKNDDNSRTSLYNDYNNREIISLGYKLQDLLAKKESLNEIDRRTIELIRPYAPPSEVWKRYDNDKTSVKHQYSIDKNRSENIESESMSWRQYKMTERPNSLEELVDMTTGKNNRADRLQVLRELRDLSFSDDDELITEEIRSELDDFQFRYLLFSEKSTNGRSIIDHSNLSIINFLDDTGKKNRNRRLFSTTLAPDEMRDVYDEGISFLDDKKRIIADEDELILTGNTKESVGTRIADPHFESLRKHKVIHADPKGKFYETLKSTYEDVLSIGNVNTTDDGTKNLLNLDRKELNELFNNDGNFLPENAVKVSELDWKITNAILENPNPNTLKYMPKDVFAKTAETGDIDTGENTFTYKSFLGMAKGEITRTKLMVEMAEDDITKATPIIFKDGDEELYKNTFDKSDRTTFTIEGSDNLINTPVYMKDQYFFQQDDNTILAFDRMVKSPPIDSAKTGFTDSDLNVLNDLTAKTRKIGKRVQGNKEFTSPFSKNREINYPKFENTVNINKGDKDENQQVTPGEKMLARPKLDLKLKDGAKANYEAVNKREDDRTDTKDEKLKHQKSPVRINRGWSKTDYDDSKDIYILPKDGKEEVYIYEQVDGKNQPEKEDRAYLEIVDKVITRKKVKKKDLFSKTAEGKSDLGYIAVLAGPNKEIKRTKSLFDTSGTVLYNIPFQFDAELSGESRNANWISTTAFGRSNDFQTWANTSSREMSFKTTIAVTSDWRIFDEKNALYNPQAANPIYPWANKWTELYVLRILNMYRALTLPMSFEDAHTSVTPPIIAVVKGVAELKWAKQNGLKISKWAVNSVSVDPRIEAGVTSNNFHRVWDISLSLKEIPDDWKDWTDAKNWLTSDGTKSRYDHSYLQGGNY